MSVRRLRTLLPLLAVFVAAGCSSGKLDESAVKNTMTNWVNTHYKNETRKIERFGPLFVEESSAKIDFTISPRPDPPKSGGLTFIPADDTEYDAYFQKSQDGKWYLVRVQGRRGWVGATPNLEVK